MVATSAPVEAVIGQLTRRIRLRAFARAAFIGVATAATISTLLMIVDRFVILPFDPLLASPLFFAVVLLVAVVYSGLPRTDSFEAIRLAEQRLGLKERLSTSMALGGDAAHVDPVFQRLLQRDADNMAPTIVPKTVVPLVLKREGMVAGAAMLVFLLVAAMNVMAPPFSNTIRAQYAALAPIADTLDSAARKIAQDAAPGSQSKAVAAELAKLAAKLRAGTTRQDAQTRIQQLSDDIARRQAEMAGPAQSAPQADPGMQQLSSETITGAEGSAHRILSDGAKDFSKTQDPHSIAVMLRKLADQLDQTPMSGGDQQKTSRDLQGFTSTLRGDGNGDAANHVANAQNALARGDQHGAAEELRQAADSIERSQSDSQKMQDAQRALAQAEQQVQQSEQQAPQGQQGGQGQQGQSNGQGQQGQSGSQGASQSGTGQGQESTGSRGGQGGQSSSQSQGAGGHSDQSGGQSGSRVSQGQNGSQGQSGAGNGEQSSGGSHGSQAGQESSGSGGSGQENNNGHGGGSEDGGQSGSGASSGSGSGENATGPSAPNANGTGRGAGGEATGHPLFGSPQPIASKSNPDPSYNEVTLPPAYDPSAAPISTGKSEKVGKTGPSTVPYYNVYPAARQTAESTVNKQSIPPGYKRAVDQYFNDIAPKR